MFTSSYPAGESIIDILICPCPVPGDVESEQLKMNNAAVKKLSRIVKVIIFFLKDLMVKYSFYNKIFNYAFCIQICLE